MYKYNPKLADSSIMDCVPQKGPCPNNCNQCFYNRTDVCPTCQGTGSGDIYDYDIGGLKSYTCVQCDGGGKIPAFYSGLGPNIPTTEEVGDKIVRVNCGHDSNIERDLVIETAKKYKHFFFNTSIPKFDFPGPVVFTANPKEENRVPLLWYYLCENVPDNLMFVRLRVSSSNLEHIGEAVNWYCNDLHVPIVLTFMAYYEEDKIPCKTLLTDGRTSIWKNAKLPKRLGVEPKEINCYEYKVRHINSYWCPTKEFMQFVLRRMKKIGDRLVTMCGIWCRGCRNCENYYFRALKHMKEVENEY